MSSPSLTAEEVYTKLSAEIQELRAEIEQLKLNQLFVPTVVTVEPEVKTPGFPYQEPFQSYVKPYNPFNGPYITYGQNGPGNTTSGEGVQTTLTATQQGQNESLSPSNNQISEGSIQ